MKFIDLAAQQRRIRKSIQERIERVLDHGQYIMGPEIDELEEKLSAYVGTKIAVGCASGTDALLLALMAYGVGPGDAVITTPFTFMATAEAVALLHAVPVFVDIDPLTFNIDTAKVEAVIDALHNGVSEKHPVPRVADAARLRVRGIIAVDLFGLPADYTSLMEVARKHDLFVIQDAAQSFGAQHWGRRAGSMAHIGCTSFFPAKPLGAYGDAGMCFTDDADLAERMRSLRIHGQGRDKYENLRIGLNGRLDTIQAAVLLAKFDIFPDELRLRQEAAERYTQGISSYSPTLVCPGVPEGYTSAWAQYSLLSASEKERETLLRKLNGAGIPTAIYYPKPLHLQPAFEFLGYREGDFPVSEDCSRRIFSIPMHPYLNKEDQDRVCRELAL